MSDILWKDHPPEEEDEEEAAQRLQWEVGRCRSRSCCSCPMLRARQGTFDLLTGLTLCRPQSRFMSQ